MFAWPRKKKVYCKYCSECTIFCRVFCSLWWSSCWIDSLYGTRIKCLLYMKFKFCSCLRYKAIALLSWLWWSDQERYSFMCTSRYLKLAILSTGVLQTQNIAPVVPPAMIKESSGWFCCLDKADSVCLWSHVHCCGDDWGKLPGQV